MELRFYKSFGIAFLGETPVYICIHKNKIWGWDKLNQEWRDMLPLFSPCYYGTGIPALIHKDTEKISRLEIAIVTGTIGPEELEEEY